MKVLIGLGLALTLLCVVLQVWARSARRPTGLGHIGGQLRPCPGTANCVSTQTQGAGRMDPIRFSGTAPAARVRLMELLETTPRVTIVEADSNYVWAEFRVPLFGFVDDVEFWIDEAQKEVHFRSASRLGQSDLGVNRARMNRIRDRLNQGSSRSDRPLDAVGSRSDMR